MFINVVFFEFCMKKDVKEFFAKSGGYLKDFDMFKKGSKSEDISDVKLKKDFDEEFFEKVLEKFHSRRSCRKYSSKPVPNKLIFDIIDVSLRAPAAGSIQNVWVCIIDDKHKIEKLSEIHGNQLWMNDAPLVLAVISDNTLLKQLYPYDWENFVRYNASTVISSIIYLSQIAGLGSCWVKAGDNDETCSVIGCAGKNVDALIPVGYSIDKPQQRDYLETSERVSFNKFGSRDRKSHH